MGIAPSKLQRVKTTLSAADGSNIEILGKITLKFIMSSKVFEHEFIVAGIHEISGILGMDFLEINDAQVLIAKPEMVLSGHKVKLYKQGHNSCFFVRLNSETVIPPKSEITLEVPTPELIDKNLSVLEPCKRLQKEGLFIARTLLSKPETKLCVNAITLSNKPIKLRRRKTTLGVKCETMAGSQFYK